MIHLPNHTITLKHLLIKEEKQIGIKFYPNKIIQAVIKGLPEIAIAELANSLTLAVQQVA